ncbi:Small ribosomal subunit biogenesis GTPase RsgA [Ralstonia edaphis]|uniref:ribosome small subunit-dependent GTPase A n=1 Tax=Ralstonia TaxID=48736 RepID=UPI0011BFA67D|nr:MULTISPECIES: ribosome small subunit-dependent GTPase A [unclassified Ralstonia]TXD62635.1 ribosome small subunit-dependent GTPase A [Ralstonia sp. TCR112]CAJ0690195.1 Small ribosomal subunit biogenesis GTPase RsgA [Ralstonia sp. LMG 6871]
MTRGKLGRAHKQAATGEHGLVIAAHGRHYLVEREGGGFLQCFPRGKRSECAVGDRVVYETTAVDQGVVVRVDERRNLLYRSDQFKSKVLAANLDQVIIMLGTEPSFSEDLLGRALVAAESLGITPLILLNKIDLTARLETARSRLALYRDLGYTIVELTVHGAPEAAHAALEPHVAGRASILIGQSGMGKSSLLNLLIPGVDAQTREISEKLDSGKHTTTFTRLYHLPAEWGQDGVLIDSPGFQEFGLHHLSEGMLERAFPEFRPRLTDCRFYNCRHLQEPGCGILGAMAEGKIDPRRHQLYAQLLHESEQQKPW